jgi:hypothetical protein
MYNKPFKIHFPAFCFTDSRPPLTIKTIWFGIGDDNDEFFNVGDIYGNANNNVRITEKHMNEILIKSLKKCKNF